MLSEWRWCTATDRFMATETLHVHASPQWRGEGTALPGPVHWGHGQGRADCAVCCSWYGYKLWKTELFPDAAAAAIGGELVDRSELAEVLHVITWTSLPISYTYMPAVNFTAATTCSCCCSWPNLLIIQTLYHLWFQCYSIPLSSELEDCFQPFGIIWLHYGPFKRKAPLQVHYSCVFHQTVYYITCFILLWYTITLVIIC